MEEREVERERSEISARFLIGRVHGSLGHPMRVLQMARSKRQREEVEVLCVAKRYRPPVRISLPRVFITLLFNNTLDFVYRTAAFVKLVDVEII